MIRPRYQLLRILVAAVLPHPVLDVVVDDEVQLLVREAVVLGENSVDLVDDGFGQTRKELIIDDPASVSVLTRLSLFLALQITHQDRSQLLKLRFHISIHGFKASWKGVDFVFAAVITLEQGMPPPEKEV